VNEVREVGLHTREYCVDVGIVGNQWMTSENGWLECSIMAGGIGLGMNEEDNV